MHARVNGESKLSLEKCHLVMVYYIKSQQNILTFAAAKWHNEEIFKAL